MDGLIVKLVENEDEMAGAVSVRMRIFVVEQQIPAEEELDEEDATATHAVAIHQEQVVGTGRLIYRGESTAQIGRMAVDQQFRRQGVGGLILQCLEEEARSQGIGQCILHAQEYVKSFYAGHGYQERGDVFLEANIRHVEMYKELG